MLVFSNSLAAIKWRAASFRTQARNLRAVGWISKGGEWND
jgi:hypothetical protein